MMHEPASENALPEKSRPRHGRGWFRSVRRVAGVVMVAYLMILVAMMWFEDSLIFVPSSSPGDDWHPWLPVRLLMRTRLNSAARIRDYHGPLLQSHGDRDTIVPLASARRLFAAAHEPKQFILIPGGDHNDPHSPEYYEQVRQFVESLK